MVASEKPPKREPPVRPGERVDRFEISGEIGRGGMGVVFRARDMELGRDVALKCPWPEQGREKTYRKRFLQEARTAARLSHPNIVQVLDAFEALDLPWLALQLVDGRTLHALLVAEGKLSPKRVLRYSEHLAEALKAAHAEGILHRDVKPGNVLLTGDDRALLADFGLARFKPTESIESSATTRSASITSAGSVVGTRQYMSPEQLLGKKVDERADIFALGAVIYEMCTGVAAFSGSDVGNLFDAIQHREPDPISKHTYEVPAELERIIRKAMAKRPEERYQSATDLLVDLRALRRKIDTHEWLDSHSDQLDTLAPAKNRKKTAIGILLAAIAVMIGYWIVRPEAPSMPAPEPRQVTSGNAWDGEPAISPDGTRIAYASNASGNDDIWIVDVHGGKPLQLTDHPASDRHPAWFPDGSAIAFESNRSGASAIWKVGQMGGGATLLIQDATGAAVSPDGARVAFIRADASGEGRIHVTSLETADDLALTDHESGLWNHRDPVWSPDGKAICYSAHDNLWIVPAGGGQAHKLTRGGIGDREPAWSPSGEHVYFASHRSGTQAIWRIASGGGEPQRVTHGTGQEHHPTVSSDGKRLAYTTGLTRNAIVIRDLQTGRHGDIPAAGSEAFFAISPDHSMLVIASERWSPRFDLWIQPLASGRPSGSPRRITDHPGNASHPVFSPDGKWIAYFRIVNDRRDLWVVPVDGGEPKPITNHPASDIHPAWSPDGRHLAFASEREGTSRISIIEMEGPRPTGPPRAVTDGSRVCIAPSWSPDGTRLAYVQQEAEGTDEVWVTEIASGAARAVTSGADAVRVRWDAGGDALFVSGAWGRESRTLMRVPLDGAEPAPLDPPVEFGPLNTIAVFDVSADGKYLVYLENEPHGDIWISEALNGSY